METAFQSRMKELTETPDEIKAIAVSLTAALSSTAVSPATAVSSIAVSPNIAVSPATAVSFTNLQDLPIEVLDNILMTAVMKKVMDKKLAKSAWVDFASRVVKQLRTVSLQWDHSLTTNWFKIVLRRKLKNCKDPTVVSVELIATSKCDSSIRGFGWLNNHICILETYPPDRNYFDCDDSILYVFEGQDTTHRIKEILLPSVKRVGGMATCKQSNSIYVWRCGSTAGRSGPAVWHLVPDGEDGFEIQQWPNYQPSGDFLDCSTVSKVAVEHISVLDDGNLLVLRRVFYEDDDGENIVSVHKPDGLVIRKVALSHDSVLSNVETGSYGNFAMKSNGNFVYSQLIHDDNSDVCIFKEVDEDGKEVGNFRWLHDCCYNDYNNCRHMFLDAYDRMIFHDGYNSLIFLDSELNFLGEVENPNEVDVCFFLLHAEFDKETSEMIVVTCYHDVLFLKLTL